MRALFQQHDLLGSYEVTRFHPDEIGACGAPSAGRGTAALPITIA